MSGTGRGPFVRGVGGSGALGWAVALLVARNVGEIALPPAAYIPANLAVGTALLSLGRRGGVSWDALGLARRQAGRGLRAGGTAAAAAAAAMLAGATLPLTRGLFDDERVAVDAGGGELAYQTLVRIPLGTVAFEELAFRGVLLGLLLRRLAPATAVAVDSALFGLWHLVPTLATARANQVTGAGRVGLLLGAVLLTAVGGAVFCGLRLRAGHLLAPALLHLAFNDVGYALSWWVRS